MSKSVQYPEKNEAEEQSSQEAQPSGTVTRYQSLALLGSSLLAAVSTLAVTMIAQRALNGSELTEFLLFWAALFTVTGCGRARRYRRCAGSGEFSAVGGSADSAFGGGGCNRHGGGCVPLRPAGDHERCDRR